MVFYFFGLGSSHSGWSMFYLSKNREELFYLSKNTEEVFYLSNNMEEVWSLIHHGLLTLLQPSIGTNLTSRRGKGMRFEPPEFAQSCVYSTAVFEVF